MNDSTVGILDLSDEILLTILKNLNNFDVLYSLVGVSKKLDNVACDINFTRNVDLIMLPSNKANDWKTSVILDRVFMCILPRIHENVECLTIQGCFLQRLLLAGNYRNLRKLILINLELKMASHVFNENSSFIHTFEHQISDLIMNDLNINVQHVEFTEDSINNDIVKNDKHFYSMKEQNYSFTVCIMNIRNQDDLTQLKVNIRTCGTLIYGIIIQYPIVSEIPNNEKQLGNYCKKLIAINYLGVDDGQFQKNHNFEIPTIRQAFDNIYGNPKNHSYLTFIVVKIRYHARFFT
ncbi:unnamed protein product [Rotaria sordida]|uniref:F-box domain-containing protein n=2 Tax=Rotaria sordida TaxID=392033 RepID=A0A815HXC2_9BILA|nr:unnamed protein product [Rotaria sordida]